VEHGGRRWDGPGVHGASSAACTSDVHAVPTRRADVVIRKSNFSPIRESWRVEGAEDGDIDLQGDALNDEFTVEKDGQAVGTTTRRWISVADAYAVQVIGMDPVLAVAASVGIDFIEQERDR